MKLSSSLLLVTFATLALHCGGADCESLCKEAQERDCTAVDGNCAAFCDSIDTVAAAGSCESQRDSYRSCLEEGDVCTGTERCSSEESALGTCVGAYCLGHADEAACMTIAES